MPTTRYVVPFADGDRTQRALLGGKGANLAEMTRIGLPVPEGFIVTTEACRAYLAEEQLPDGLMDEVRAHLTELEAAAGKRLGDDADPLLVSVRSGAPFSMPGMMDTVLNLGLHDGAIDGLAKVSGDERFAWDAYRRLIQLYGKIVLGVDGERFDHAMEEIVEASPAEDEGGLGTAEFKEAVERFLAIVEQDTGAPFPQDPAAQLEGAIAAVFRSWNGRRARDYRRMEGIPDDLGTAVNIQRMVFGNLGDDSGTGVAFTRDPATGERVPYGDWLVGAQGEDVVAGLRVTEPLASLADHFPQCYADLEATMATLEAHERDMCDIEFTIEHGKLFMLQTRIGKRSAAAALRMAVEMVEEGLIDTAEAVKRVKPDQLEQLLHPQFSPDAKFETLTTGLAASPGAATGKVVFTADDAAAWAEAGEDVLLVRNETSPDDLHGMIAAQGILTARGGLVSHAAVVARGMGTPAVCGANELKLDMKNKTFTVNGVTVKEGEVISISGNTGKVVVGEVPVIVPKPEGPFTQLLAWADEYRTLKVRTNADTGPDVKKAVELGAEGVGLCRTEHMFFGDRLPVVRRMLLADNDTDRSAALEELLEVQREDFVELLRELDGLPTTVRLLDPPLHEFLPDITELVAKEARGELTAEDAQLLAAARSLEEENPMLGTRGCRLGIIQPDIIRMQVRALLEAAVAVKKEGLEPIVEIMVPLIVDASELELISEWIHESAKETLAAAGVEFEYLVGTMVETPRAALTSGKVAESADFFSYGTNDLTQMTYGFSRDDIEATIMPTYLELGLFEANPFSTVDVHGVGRLMQLSVEEGRAVKPELKLGICGEHGGDPATVIFCHEIGLSYVSCSPFRVPVARLAAAHAALGQAGPTATA